ncbi:methyl-accepting chemotaxis protein [Vibrio sp. SCSIO 43136]|uniref:methyl-accepting chemotaxis protein n=1 Tax=Vibrio sp. SCSIO 43136 TaxID=2819101 RepID=UPI0020759AF6|nr:methyl-accepting chemotaxis protein [Vibrio sp. SCSIO 43136]USD67588.1 methyl-accepting chemotaxis protein [Vibrio sp. SCSIO 43136]
MKLSLIQRIILGFGLVLSCVIAIGGTSLVAQSELGKQLRLTASTLTELLDQSNGLLVHLQDANRATLVHANTFEQDRRSALVSEYQEAVTEFSDSMQAFQTATVEFPELSPLYAQLNDSAQKLLADAKTHQQIHDERLLARQKSAESLSKFEEEWLFFNGDMTDFGRDANADDNLQAGWDLEFMMNQGRGAESYLQKLMAVQNKEQAATIVAELEQYYSRFNEKTENVITLVPGYKEDIRLYDDILKNVVHNPEQLVRLHIHYIDLNAQSKTTLEQISREMDNATKLSKDLISQIRTLSRQALVSAETDASSYEKMTVALIVIATIIAIGIAFTVVRSIRAPLAQILTGIERMKHGDLTHSIQHAGSSELGKIADGMNDLSGNLRHLISEIIESAGTLGDVAETSNSMTKRTNNDVELQQEKTNSIATAVTEMEQAVQEVASHSNESNLEVERVVSEAQNSMESMNQNLQSVGELKLSMDNATQVMNNLSSETNKISEIVGVIQGISEQTNLLALNAAIEAARAGEQGRGFAVVADEVRSLATKTNDATNQINDMITGLQGMSKQAVSIVEQNLSHVDLTSEQINKTNDTLVHMVESLARITDMSRSIATACEEQTVVAGEVAVNIVGISEMSSSIAKGSNELATNSGLLNDLSSNQIKLVSEFKV